MTNLLQAAKQVVERWNSPDWKDQKHTGDYIHELRQAIAQAEQNPQHSTEYWQHEVNQARSDGYIRGRESAQAEQQEPVDQVGVKHDTQLAETFLRCPMTGNQLYFANEPIQKKGMNYMRLQDKEGNDWTLIARLDEGWDGK